MFTLFTENLSFKNKTADNMQSIHQNMNLLPLCDKNSTTVKASDISETSAKASPLNSVTALNLHNNNNNNRFIGSKLKDNTSKTVRSRDDEERKGVSEIICKLLQYLEVPEVEIDRFSGNLLDYQYFV